MSHRVQCLLKEFKGSPIRHHKTSKYNLRQVGILCRLKTFQTILRKESPMHASPTIHTSTRC